MSDVTPTMKFVDHKAPSSVSIDTIQVEQQEKQDISHILEDFAAREQVLLGILREIVDRPIATPVVNVTAPAISMPDRVEMQAPVIHANLPPLDIPTPQVQVSVNLFSQKVAAIIVGILLLQSIAIGVLAWR